MFLPMQSAPKCVADLPGHDAEEVWRGVHAVCGSGDSPPEGPCGVYVVGPEELRKHLNGATTSGECVALLPVLFGEVYGMSVSPEPCG